MPEATFEVESYTVLTSHHPGGASYRHLGLTSAALAHDIRTRASIFFFDKKPAELGVVHNVDQPNNMGHSVYVHSWTGDYNDAYNLLGREKPLSFRYGYDGPEFDPAKPARALNFVQLFTGTPEPPGKGPADVSPALP